MDKEYLTVFSGDVARAMLHKGYRITDLKKDKLDSEGKRSIYIFKNEEGLSDAIQEYKKEKENKETV